MTGDLARSDVTPCWKPERTRKPARRTPDDVAASAAFKATVSQQPCIADGVPGHECETPMQAMHVISQQTLRKRGLEHLLWEPDNGVNGCYRVHRRHDLCVEKIPWTWLPYEATRWATRHGLIDSLHRHWPNGPSKREVIRLTDKFTGLCVLCQMEDGTPFKIVPTGSFTTNNLLCVGVLCRELVRRRKPAAHRAILELVHADDARYTLVGDDAAVLYPAAFAPRSGAHVPPEDTPAREAPTKTVGAPDGKAS